MATKRSVLVVFSVVAAAVQTLTACKARQASSLHSVAGGSADTGQNPASVATTKATCPFIGSAVATKALPIVSDGNHPLAAIKDVVALGDSGGGDLGSRVLVIFAKGNHAFTVGTSGKLDKPVPNGTFSLEFPGSKGSHPGHSGILQGDPKILGSGRFDEAAFNRLLAYAHDGHINRSAVGQFIGDNLARDPNSKVFGPKVATLLGGDILAFAGQIGPALVGRLESHLSGTTESTEERQLFTAFTTITGEDNLVGSAGEFGLLFAFLANSPKTTNTEGEPALSVDDLTAMFKDKVLPQGWQEWKKTSHEWVVSTTALLHAAAVRYIKLKPGLLQSATTQIQANTWLPIKTEWSHVSSYDYDQKIICKFRNDWWTLSGIEVRYTADLASADVRYYVHSALADPRSETRTVSGASLTSYEPLMTGTFARPPQASGDDAYQEEVDQVADFVKRILEPQFTTGNSRLSDCSIQRNAHEGRGF